MYKRYTKQEFKDLRKQHNIFVLVGNGFDISVIKKYKEGKMKGKTTSYSDFYDYITYYNLSNEDNVLYKKMKDDRGKNKENWSDFENTINELYDEGKVSVDELERCIDEFQSHFTRFLNEIVDADTLVKLSDDIKEKHLSYQTLGKFLYDITELSTLRFVKNISYYDLFYYMFANLNYTSLLDNYLYLDKSQFDPHKWTSVDRNFDFIYKLDIYKLDTVLSSYLISEVIHPHGVQDIPRSMLFGIDLDKYDRGKSTEKRLTKSYWSQYDVKYKSYLESAELFIIYGMSFGKTDAWWMDMIFDRLVNNKAELIIYYYGDKDESDVKELFINCCIRHSEVDKEEKQKVMNNIYVVTFLENNTYFLGLENKEIN